MKKIGVLIVALILLAMLFVGCNKKEEAPSVGGTLRFAWWGNPTRDERTLQVVRLFEQKNPRACSHYAKRYKYRPAE